MEFRLKQLRDAVAADAAGRVQEVRYFLDEIETVSYTHLVYISLQQGGESLGGEIELGYSFRTEHILQRGPFHRKTE